MTPILTPSLKSNPRLDRWIAFQADKTARVASGKVEIGQGIVTALRQIAAEELDLPLDRVVVASGDTAIGPDEMYTTSSLSVSVSGASIRLVAAEARKLLIERAALRLNCAPEDIAVVAGAFQKDGAAVGLDYWDVAGEIDWSADATGTAATKPPSAYSIVGQSAPRTDLPAKLSGGGFVHDATPSDALHARALRQPRPGAELTALDEVAIRRAARGEIEIVRRANFVAFLGEDEWTVERAAAAAPDHAEWRLPAEPPAGAVDPHDLPDHPAVEHVYGDAAPAAGADADALELTVSRPYVAHASMGPSAALARFADGTLEICSHGQGMHPLRRNLALALEMDEAAIHCRHIDGPGCYGHNGADDAALDAAIVALERPGRWVRAQWRREEEFGFEPVGPAMLVKVRAELDSGGKPTGWMTDVWSPVHVQRPGAPGVVMLAAQALRPLPAWGPPVDPPPERGYGGARNAFPAYDVGPVHVRHHLTERAPVRTSALRGLGALPNVVAIEGLIDELAAKAGADPVDYRLDLLGDPRARAVVEKAADLSGWRARAAGTGEGWGIGFARYKNIAGYATVIVQLSIDEEVRLERIWAVADAGLAINPDGVRNQLEGGCIQGASWALKEAVAIEDGQIVSTDWDSYPILRFSEIPEIDVACIDRPDEPTLGVGECTVGPTAAAIANAIADALGRRMRDMPFTRERLMATLLND